MAKLALLSDRARSIITDFDSAARAHGAEQAGFEDRAKAHVKANYEIEKDRLESYVLNLERNVRRLKDELHRATHRAAVAAERIES